MIKNEKKLHWTDSAFDRTYFLLLLLLLLLGYYFKTVSPSFRYISPEGRAKTEAERTRGPESRAEETCHCH